MLKIAEFGNIRKQFEKNVSVQNMKKLCTEGKKCGKTSYQLHRSFSLCVSWEGWQYLPSVVENSGNTQLQDSYKLIPRTHARSDVSKPTKGISMYWGHKRKLNTNDLKQLTSKESPLMMSAQSFFRLKLLSSRCASERLLIWNKKKVKSL